LRAALQPEAFAAACERGLARKLEIIVEEFQPG
jgi:hypothetical protein